MNEDDTFFDYEEIEYVRRVFSICYTQIVLQSHMTPIGDEILDQLGDLEDRLIQVIRERACH